MWAFAGAATAYGVANGIALVAWISSGVAWLALLIWCIRAYEEWFRRRDMENRASFEELEELEEIEASILEELPEPKSLEERTETHFQDQYQKGCVAFEQGDWKDAVRYLTVASALKPNIREVEERLRIAEAKHRQTEKRLKHR
jgi:hypothetical protein